MRISDWSSDVCSSDLAVVGIVRLSKAAYRKSLQNLWWAAGYNVLAIPIAAGALSWAGVNMPPALAAVLMSASRSEEHTSELQSLMRISYAVFCLKKKKKCQQMKTQYEDEQHKQK